MEKKPKWIRVVYLLGVITIIAGIIDPLEGSILVSAGILLILISAFAGDDPDKKLFLFSAIMIVFGVFFLFYFSSLGGFGGKSGLSWWWVILILPYPAGWIMAIAALIRRVKKKNKPGT